ncbi:hypothetical protein LZ30DRAFT_786342 [Colletotrichum cereale]|nr:hypothetical protein LZ30DRAFT_786342 [Colletotrichum cereale]
MQITDIAIAPMNLRKAQDGTLSASIWLIKTRGWEAMALATDADRLLAEETSDGSDLDLSEKDMEELMDYEPADHDKDSCEIIGETNKDNDGDTD